MINILYEDKHLIVCVKPVGVLSQESTINTVGMVTILTEYLSKTQKDPYIGVIHRLDLNVGGIMVYAKTKEAAGKLSQAISSRDFTKEYITVINGVPKERKGTYVDLLFKDSSKNKSFVVKRMRKGVKEASLDYEVLSTTEMNAMNYSFVKVHLNTGRTHQIRVQFSSRQMPLLGDGKYGGNSNQSGEIALWSYHLRFQHPITNKVIDEKILPNQMFPWSLFSMEGL